MASHRRGGPLRWVARRTRWSDRPGALLPRRLRQTLGITLIVALCLSAAVEAQSSLSVTPASADVPIFGRREFTVSGATQSVSCTPLSSEQGSCRASSTERNVIIYTAPAVLPSNRTRRAFQLHITEIGTSAAIDVPIQLLAGIDPISASVLPGGTQEFRARLDSPPYTWSVDRGGSLSATSGDTTRFTAGSTPGAFTLTLRNDLGESDRATINVTATRISLTNRTASAGARNVRVQVVSNEALNLGAYTFIIRYDVNILLATGGEGPSGGFVNPAPNNRPAGSVVANFASTSGLQVAAAERIFEVTFDILPTAAQGETVLTLEAENLQTPSGAAIAALIEGGAITIEQGGSIQGSVRDASGNPVANALITASGTAGEFTASSGATGSFSLTGISPGAYTLSASAAGFLQREVRNLPVTSGRTTTSNFILEAAEGTLQGQVTAEDTSQPIAGAFVRIGRVGPTAATDAEGRYRFEALRPGEVTVIGGAAGFTEVSQEVTIVAGGSTTHDIALARALGNLRGFVRAAETAEPIPGATVRVEGFENLSAQSDPAGSYILQNVPAIPVNLLATALGYLPLTTRNVLVRPNAFTPLNLLLTSQRNASISGIARSSLTGRELADITITVTAPDGVQRSSTTDSRGNYTIGELPTGRFTVAPDTTGFLPTCRLAVRPRLPALSPTCNADLLLEAGSSRNIDFILQPRLGAMQGVVRNAATLQPIEGARLTTQRGGLRATTDAQGRFTLSGLPPDTWIMVATAAGFGFSREATVEVRGGETASVEMELNPRPTVTEVSPASGTTGGTVELTMQGSGFLAGISASLRRRDAEPIAATSTTLVSATQLRATFSLANVEPSTYAAVVTNTDGQVGVLPEAFQVNAVASGSASSATPFVTTVSNPTEGATIRLVVNIGSAASAQVVVTFPDGSSQTFQVTTSNQAIEIAGAPAGTFTISLTLGGGSAASQSGKGATSPPSFELKRQGGSQSVSISSTVIEGIGVITGRTFDDFSGTGLTGVELRSNTGGLSVSADGFYLLTVPAGLTAITASLESFQSATTQGVEVQGGNTQLLDIPLTPVSSLVINSGNEQSGLPGATLPQPLVVQLTQQGEPVVGALIQFSVERGGGRFAESASQVEVQTDSEGKAQAEVNLGEAGPNEVKALFVAGGDEVTFIAQAAGQSNTTVTISPGSGPLDEPFDFSFTVQENGGLEQLDLDSFTFLINGIDIAQPILDLILLGVVPVEVLGADGVRVTFANLSGLPSGETRVTISIGDQGGGRGTASAAYARP